MHDALQKSLSILTSRPLTALNFACELMMFSFGEYRLHSQCLTRVLLYDEILFTTQDFQSWDGEKQSNNDLWYFAEKFRERIIGGKVHTIDVSPLYDLRLTLDNGVSIELFTSNGFHHYGEEAEQWVFFHHHDHSFPFVTVYNKSVSITKGS